MAAEQHYQCPGETVEISRAVHLSRLDRFYPPCRHCSHRNDTGAADPSDRLRRRLDEHGVSAVRLPQLTSCSIAGLRGEVEDRRMARRAAARFVQLLASSDSPTDAEMLGTTAGRPILLATDGRSVSTSLISSLVEGLRRSGASVVDLGEATIPALVTAIDKEGAAGGVMVGEVNYDQIDRSTGEASDEMPGENSDTVARLHLADRAALKFWVGPLPLTDENGLAEIETSLTVDTPRASRRSGRLARASVTETYLQSLASHYHGLRPLRFIYQAAGRPIGVYLKSLTEHVAVRGLSCPIDAKTVKKQIDRHGAHFAVAFSDDGGSLQLWDQRGDQVAASRFASLITKYLRQRDMESSVVTAGGGYLDTARAMYRDLSPIGVDDEFRIWRRLSDTAAAPDALWAITLLLEILSRDARPLSQTLDDECPVG